MQRRKLAARECAGSADRTGTARAAARTARRGGASMRTIARRGCYGVARGVLNRKDSPPATENAVPPSSMLVSVRPTLT